jgi:hypothetical protein
MRRVTADWAEKRRRPVLETFGQMAVFAGQV